MHIAKLFSSGQQPKFSCWIGLALVLGALGFKVAFAQGSQPSQSHGVAVGIAARQLAHVGPLPTGPGILSWDDLAQVRESKIINVGQLPAHFAFRMRPEFSPRMRALEGKRVRIAGFLHNVTESNESIISLVPLSDDDGCSSGTSTNRVAVTARAAIAPSATPLVIEGTLAFFDETERSGLYYALRDSVVVNK